jgi:hypothetical protein
MSEPSPTLSPGQRSALESTYAFLSGAIPLFAVGKGVEGQGSQYPSYR